MSNDKYNVHILESVTEVDNYKSIWDELYKLNLEAHPYLCYDYFRTVLKYFGKLNNIKVAILKKGSETYGIVPFQLKQKTISSLRIRYIQVCPDKWPPTYAGILSENNNQLEVIQNLLNYMANKDNSISYCLLKNALVGSRLFISNETMNGPTGKFKFVKQKTRQCLVIKLPSSWEAYMKELSYNNRKSMKKKTKAMTGLHDLKLLSLSNKESLRAESLKSLLADALQIAKNSWQGSAVKGKAISDVDTRPFFEEVSIRLSALGRLDLSVLYADKIPISFVWGVSRWPVIYPLKQGFDSFYDKLSPGVVHYSMYIPEIIKNGGTRIDLGEYHEYKKRWSKLSIDVYDQIMFPKSIKGSLFAKILLLRKKLKKS